MIEKLASRTDLQLAALSAALILSALIQFATGFNPLMLPSVENAMIGIAIGVVIAITTFTWELAELRRRKKKRDSTERPPLGAALTATSILSRSIGEETLLRGFAFASLLIHIRFPGSFYLWIFLSGLISGLLYSRKGAIAYVAAIQGAILALIYAKTHSLFAVIIARLLAEVASELANRYHLPEKALRKLHHGRSNFL
jgi:hypothetical protein